jgi:hypothetical protein
LIEGFHYEERCTFVGWCWADWMAIARRIGTGFAVLFFRFLSLFSVSY